MSEIEVSFKSDMKVYVLLCVLIFLPVLQSRDTRALEDVCSCDAVEIVTTKDVVLKKHGQLLGRYHRRYGKESLLNKRPTYEHFSGKYFLYYSNRSQGFWAVGERIGSEVVRLENQGDRMCPYYLKSMWRYADGDLNALIYDVSLRVACMTDPCSVVKCGHQASCFYPQQGESIAEILKKLSRNPNVTTTTTPKPDATCECKPGFVGNPYERCYPANVTNGCNCERLVFSSRNTKAIAKHENSYGEFFLFDVRDGQPIYQHFAGIEYLYKRDGHWLISDKIGLHEAGLQNQGESGGIVCPYRFRTSWEYADVERPGWQWVYDHTARLICPNDPCSVTKCGFHSSCTVVGDQGVCACDVGYSGNPYERCYPQIPAKCSCQELMLSSAGPSAMAQSDKMGRYFLYGYYNRKPAYQHESGLDYLFYAEGEAWVIGAMFGGARVGIVNFDKSSCPYQLKSFWRHSVRGKLEKDPGILMACASENQEEPGNPAIQTTTTTTTEASDLQSAPSIREDFIPSDNLEKLKAQIQQVLTTSTPSTTTTTATTTTTGATEKYIYTTTTDGPPRAPLVPQPAVPRTDEFDTIESTEDRTNATLKPAIFESTVCDCPRIVITSQNPNTIEKHGNQLGHYRLNKVQNGRPVYQHETNQQFLYYHPYSGGNWLINSAVGLLYGGIQNSKDVPLCPYLINTMWQFGDSELGGWVYDPTLRVTCPTDPCSVLKCGFRAQCVYDSTKQAHCVCRPGYAGNPIERCYPEQRQEPCQCLKVRLMSTGPARRHQADKMGEYHLWGYFNNRTVYQHKSGLDFLYYHKNNVWGVGPKIGGNSAGLLNFGRNDCPYNLDTPWEFGTRQKSKSRQVDYQLSVKCIDQVEETTKVDKLKCGSFTVQNGNPHAEFPWQASITVSSRPGTKMHLCSAVILSPKHVLTTASCLTEYPMKKYRVVTSGRNQGDVEQEFSIQSIFTHDMYDETTTENDLALVKLKIKDGGYISFGPYTQPICLSATTEMQKLSKCKFSGWIKENPLQGFSGTLTDKLAKCANDKHVICVESELLDLEKGMPLTCVNSQGPPNHGILVGLYPGWSKVSENPTKKTTRFLKIKPYLDWITARLKL